MLASLATLVRTVVACALLGVLSFPGGAHALVCPPLPAGIRLAVSRTPSSGALPVAAGIVGGIVPHHDVAGAMILRFYATLKASGLSPKRVVLIAPDHYRAGRGSVTVCGADWETSSGTLRADAAAVDAIVRSGAASRDDRIFGREHGVSTHLPLIREGRLAETRALLPATTYDALVAIERKKESDPESAALWKRIALGTGRH